MIKFDSFDISVNHFPDGTQKINLPSHISYSNNHHCIYWVYDGEEEYMTLFYIVNHVRNNSPVDIRLDLFMPYVPNARQDRVYNQDEVFTLKYFCNFINSMRFNSIYVMDVHSDVTLALLNNVRYDDANNNINQIITRNFFDVPATSFIMFYPDSGSVKRYSRCEYFKSYPD